MEIVVETVPIPVLQLREPRHRNSPRACLGTLLSGAGGSKWQTLDTPTALSLLCALPQSCPYTAVNVTTTYSHSCEPASRWPVVSWGGAAQGVVLQQEQLLHWSSAYLKPGASGSPFQKQGSEKVRTALGLGSSVRVWWQSTGQVLAVAVMGCTCQSVGGLVASVWTVRFNEELPSIPLDCQMCHRI